MSTQTIDEAKVEQFVFQAVGELGATLNAALVVIGDQLGLYKAMAGAGPLTLGRARASAPARSERYVREWLNAQAAGGYVDYDAATSRYTLPPEQAIALADEDSPAFLPGAFQLMPRPCVDEPKITEAFRSGAGVGWHEHNARPLRGQRALLPPRLQRRTSCTSWLPALDGVEEKLERGRARRRRRLRPRRLDDPDGARRSRTRASSASTTTRRRSRRARARGRGRRRRPRHLRGRLRAGLPGDGYDLVDDVRLPARHGRPGRRRAAHPRVAGPGRHVDDRRAVRGRPRRGQPEPGRARLLRGLDAALHAGVAVAGGRARARRPGRRGAAPRRASRPASRASAA